MALDNFPEKFDPTRCVLFLGAGFSADAKNKRGANPPVGDGLGKAIKTMAGIPQDDQADLADAAGYAISQKFDLFSLLEGLYTIREITEYQRKVLLQPWWRIYTTNYDNSISVFRSENGRNATEGIFDLTDDVPRRLKKGAVIHLHGSVAKCNREKIDESIVLSRRSYVEQRVKKSPWWNWFDRDIRTSQYIFFLGYDLNDFEPASYLIQYPGIKEQRHFILRSPRSPIAESKLNDYGFRHSFGLNGFVERLSRAEVAPAPSHENELNSFRYVDLAKDNKLPSTPGSAEIQELFAFGRLRFDAIRATLPESKYVVFRKAKLDECEEALRENRTIIVHGKIGNGKSVFCNELKVSLSKLGHGCFELRENIAPLPQDIDFIKSVPSAIIFFPSYDSAVTNFHLLDGLPDSVRYVVEIPSSTLLVRMDEVRRHLPGRIARIGIDKLSENDASKLRSLLKQAGLSKLSLSTEIRRGLEFRDFLLMSYDDPEIARRLKSVIDPLIQYSESKKIIVATAIIKASGLKIDTGLIQAATGEDPYATLSDLGEAVYELMEFDLDNLEPHSSVLSEHILKKYINHQDFVQAIFDLAVEAARRINEAGNSSTERFRGARAILSSLLRFSFVESIVGSGPDKTAAIKNLYEKCRTHNQIEQEPLFWLQYSIFWRDEARLDLAESHMKEAYSRAAAQEGFKTFQLDTNYLGLLCELEFNVDVGQPITRFDSILELVDVCQKMIDDGNHRGHVINSFLKIEPMIIKRNGDFTKMQSISIISALNIVMQRLDNFSLDDKAMWGTEYCKISLERSVFALTNRSYV